MVKSTAPFSSSTVHAGAVGQQVNADELGAGRGGGANREQERIGRRVDGNASCPEADVRAPLPLGGDPRDRPDRHARRDDDAKVVPRRLDQLLHEHALLLEPRLVLEFAKVAAESDLVLAANHVAAPATETRLDYDGTTSRAGPGPSGCNSLVQGMRQPLSLEETCRQQLVVDSEQGSGAIEHPDTPGGERPERPEPVLDTVQLGRDVEPADRGVARTEHGGRLLGGQHARVNPARSRGGKRSVGRGPAPGDEGEQHALYREGICDPARARPSPLPPVYKSEIRVCRREIVTDATHP